MNTINFFVFTFLLCCGFVFPQNQVCEYPSLASNVSKHIRARTELVGPASKIICYEDKFCRSPEVSKFYTNRRFIPAWSDNTGLLPVSEALVFALKMASQEGLSASEYHIKSIESKMDSLFIDCLDNVIPDSEKLAELDLLLTDAFFLYTTHLANGRVKMRTYQTDFIREPVLENLPSLLEEALEKEMILETIESVKPIDRGYINLTVAFNRYQEIVRQGGWPVIPPGGALKRGSRGERVGLLHKRLAITRDLKEGQDDNTHVFGPAMDEAVRHFQKRYNLVMDGIVGQNTLAELNVPASERLLKIKLNMERWRWLPRNLGNRYIRVDIPSFKLNVIENDHSVLNMKVIVGKLERPTPLVAKTMSYLVINPYWYIPPKIAIEDKLPLIRRDPGYFSRNNIRVYRGGVQINPRGINWYGVGKNNFSFSLRQTPGAHNALGRIKFMFPNKYSVYLHDTPKKHLFRSSVRTFSSGCVRIEKPVSLAEYLLKDQPGWTKEKIQSLINSSKSRTIKLKSPLPVYLMYWTVWADEDGFPYFGPDIYGLDTLLAREMR